jgi:hypothetical protein
MSDSSVHSYPRTIPAEIDRWNWGAFLFHFIWGLRNNSYITLLVIVPALLGGIFDHAYRAQGGRRDPGACLPLLFRHSHHAFRVCLEGQCLGMAQQAMGQRRAFQGCATLVGEMGSHHLDFRAGS